MPFDVIDQRRIDTTGLGGGGAPDFVYASRAAAIAASPASDLILVLHQGRALLYSKADPGLAYPALTTANSQKWEPADGQISPLHWGAVGDGATDDHTALQSTFNYLVGATSDMLAAYVSGKTWTVSGRGKRYATSKPVMIGNLGDGVGLIYFAHVEDLHLKAIQGAYSWATTYGSGEVPSRVLVLAWQLNEDASDSITGIYKMSFRNVNIDCNFITGGIYIQNTTQLAFRDVGIDFLGKSCDGFQTSVGNKAQNPRGYKTVNGALLVENMNVQGYVEEAPRGAPLYPTGEDQDTMNTVAFRVMTNDARYHQIICSRVTQAMYINYCGAIQFSDMHPWSKLVYIGANTSNLMFSNCYFDYTKVEMHPATWSHRFVACHWILGGVDRGVELFATDTEEDGDGLMFVGCAFKGDNNDIDITYTDVLPGYWRGPRDRKLRLEGCTWGANATPEIVFKAGFWLTVDGSDGYTYLRRTADGYGKTQIGGSLITLGLDRTIAGVAGLYLQSSAGSVVADASVYATSGGNLVLETSKTTGEVVFGVNGFWGGTRVKPDSDMQIFGTTLVSTAATALKVGKNSTRSISAAGTINASGADYAEYHQVVERLWGKVAKGAVLGFDADGFLTDRFDDVRGRFVIKSSEPNLVGNDLWGSEEYLCETYGVESVGEKPDLRVAEPTADDLAAHEEAVVAWEIRRDAMRAAHETERVKWDRIAKSGVVPVLGIPTEAKVGDYLVPKKAADGGIEVELVAEPDLTLRQYVRSIGCVNGFFPDGRPMVEVKVT